MMSKVGKARKRRLSGSGRWRIWTVKLTQGRRRKAGVTTQWVLESECIPLYNLKIQGKTRREVCSETNSDSKTHHHSRNGTTTTKKVPDRKRRWYVPRLSLRLALYGPLWPTQSGSRMSWDPGPRLSVVDLPYAVANGDGCGD